MLARMMHADHDGVRWGWLKLQTSCKPAVALLQSGTAHTQYFQSPSLLSSSDFTSHSPSAPQTFPRQFSGYSAVHTHSKSAHGRSLTRLFTCYSNKFHSVFMEMQLIIQGRPLNKGSCNCRNTCIVCTRYCTTLYSYSDVLTLELSSQAGQSPQSPGDRHTHTQDG